MIDSNKTESIKNLWGNTEEVMNTPEVTAWMTGLPNRLAQALGGPVDLTFSPVITRPVLRIHVCVPHLNVTLDYEIDSYTLRMGTVGPQATLEVETLRFIDRIQAFLHNQKLVEA